MQHENKYSSVNAIQSMQDFLDNAVHLKLWEAAKSLVEVVGAILDIKKMIHAPQAAAKGISGGDEMYVHAHKGVYDAFGQSSISTKVAPYPPGALRYSSTETSAELLAKLRQSQADYAEIVSLLVSKMMSGDTTGLEQLLEDFLIADSHYDMVLDAFVGMADAGYDSALAYIPCFDSVYKEIYTSAFTTKSDMISSLIYVFAFAIDPSDTTYIPDATNQLSLTIETMDSNYQSLSSNAGLLLSVPASPVLQVWSYSESEVLELDSATTLHFLVKNIGTGTSLGRYVHFATDSSLVLESPDSLSISDLEPQDSLMLSCTVRAVVPDSVFGPVTSGLVCVDVFSDNALTKSTVGSILIKLYSAGDANGDGVIDIGDVVYLINYLYRNGPAPNPLEAGDANYDAIIDIGDVVYLINYLYRGGPPPCN
ncbi:MAG: dockerin type I repeat-containing protein [Candidatus Zixiibacteriota bacterium]